MPDLSKWPRRGTGIPNDRIGGVVPAEWKQIYDDDIRDILLYSGAENKSHADILAVHEMAERLRKENE